MLDIKPKEFTVGSLFSGIGGLDLGLERAGMRVKWQCEIDPYCRAVLAHHWPGLPVYENIRDIDGTVEHVDLICGGFPCQPVSLAGKGLAQKDPRWLWPEFARVVGELRPRYVLVENVPGLVKRGLDLVITGLAEMGYDAEWQIVSAASVGAPHLRERIIIVGHANGEGKHGVPIHAEVAGKQELLGHANSTGLEGHGRPLQGAREGIASASSLQRDVPDAPRELPYRPRYEWKDRRAELADSSWWLAEPPMGRLAHGVPNRVAQLRALGNAVVPQVAEAVGRMILASA